MWGDYETCGFFSPSDNVLSIDNVSANGVYTLKCISYGGNSINFHSHPRERYTTHFSGLPSNTDFKSLIQVTRHFNSPSSDHIISNQGILKYSTTQKALIDNIDESYIDYINPNGINDAINGIGDFSTIVTNFINKFKEDGYFEFEYLLA